MHFIIHYITNLHTLLGGVEGKEGIGTTRHKQHSMRVEGNSGNGTESLSKEAFMITQCLQTGSGQGTRIVGGHGGIEELNILIGRATTKKRRVSINYAF